MNNPCACDDAMALALRLITALPTGLPGLFNPWRDVCSDDQPWNGPEEKLQRLADHLRCSPRFILCGEAPGYQGCRHTGVAFTSERLLLEGEIPRLQASRERLTRRRRPFSEPSATIVWQALHRLGIADVTLLWNALQLHPHLAEDHNSNRTPTSGELELGKPAMNVLVQAFPQAQIVAVGRKAENLLARMDIPIAGSVRHPANGGASEFADGLERLVALGGSPA